MAKKKSPGKKDNPFKGRWRIDSMEMWDEDFIHEEEEGRFEFGENNSGVFHFGYVHAQIDYRTCEREGKPSVEFSFEGSDEMETVLGRGWASLENDSLVGRVFFHQGNDSGFTATKKR